MSNSVNNKGKGIEINIAYLVKTVISKWWLILTVSVLCASFGFTFAELTKTPSYTSSVSFVVSNRYVSEEDAYSSSDLNASITMANTYKYILSSRTMCKKIAETCSYDISAEEVSGAIQMKSVDNTNIIVMNITTSSAAKSYDLAVAAINHYGSIVDETGYSNSRLSICELPVAAKSPDVNYSGIKYVLVGAFAGAIISLIAILIANISKDTVQSAEEIQEKLNMNVMGLVSKINIKGKENKNKALLINNRFVGFSFVETYKAIRTKIENVSAKNGYKTFVVSSAGENEGKTTVASNIAISLAQNGHSVLLIDADLRRPSVCGALDLNIPKDMKTYSLADVINGTCSAEKAIRYIERHKIFLLAGTHSVSDPAEVLSNPKMEEVLRVMRNEFDFIIFDTSPAGVVTDASILTNYVDAVVCVVREDHSPMSKIRMAFDDLSSGKAEIIGCIYNNVASARGFGSYNRYYSSKRYGGYKYGYYGYGYGYGDNGYGSDTDN